RFQARLAEVAPHQPDLVCLPECAFTGYLYETQDFEKFAEPIPGETTAIIAKLAQENQCYVCFGMLEKAKDGVYSSAVLVDKSGRVIHVHRKIIEQPPFATGKEVKAVDTEFGTVSVLLCGDLFDDDVKARISRDTDILILPLARSFDGKSPDLERWQNEERQAYVDEVKKVGVTGLIVNSLEDSSLPEASFGGAMVVSPNGEVLAETEHGTDKALIFELVSVISNGG
ncbi:MAG: carbon-nitrogen hydrolase family protein, partial [Oscillochloridaceae bacterium]|nr:carbon-nitrogen hydrolase family protein [Oscillochloridaceae bacterium]